MKNVSDVECDEVHAELISKLMKDNNYLVPPDSNNITVSVDLELSNLLEIVRKE